MYRFPHFRRRLDATKRRTASLRPQLELLEARNLLSGPGSALTPLVQVSSDPSPFLNSPASNGSEVGVVNSDNAETEPQVAVDPTNPRHLAGAWIQDYKRGIVAGVSFNGGNTWQDVVIPGTSISSGGTTFLRNGDPWVSFAANGDLYVSLAGGNPTLGLGAVLVSKSSDGGLTWGAPSTIILDDFSKFREDKPSITADPTNPKLVYLVWSRLHVSTNELDTMFSETTNGGQTWSQAQKIFSAGGSSTAEDNQVEVLPNGTLVDFFTVTKNTNSRSVTTIDLLTSPDQGQTWSNQPIQVATIVPSAGSISLDLPNPNGGTAVRAPYWLPEFAVDPNSGNLYAVWQDARFSNLQYDSIAFSMSRDGGTTWSAPLAINQTPTTIPTLDQQAFVPSVAVAANGTVAVTYYDFRFNSGGPALLTDYWLVQGAAGTDLTNPANWGHEERITSTSFEMTQAMQWNGYFVGDYEGLVASGNSFGAFFSMPQGTDPGNIYFRDPVAARGHAAAATASTRTATIPHAASVVPSQGGATANASGPPGRGSNVPTGPLPADQFLTLLGNDLGLHATQTALQGLVNEVSALDSALLARFDALLSMGFNAEMWIAAQDNWLRDLLLASLT